MKRSGSVLVAVCMAGSLCVASLATAETAAPAGAVVAATTVQVTATVVKIDLKKRRVTLKAADGREQSFVVDEAVKNLDQVKEGDLVVATYAEALVYEVKKGGAAVPPPGQRWVPRLRSPARSPPGSSSERRP